MNKASYFYLAVISILLIACQKSTENSSIETLTLVKAFDEQAKSNEICRTFTLDKKKVSQYFKYATEVTSEVFNDEAIILPCKYQGTIKIDGKIYNWKIMAGGAGYLYNDSSVNKRYLCKDDCCDKIKGLG